MILAMLAMLLASMPAASSWAELSWKLPRAGRSILASDNTNAFHQLVPRGVDAELLFTVAPSLRTVAEPLKSLDVIDKHTRQGSVERQRHDALLYLLHSWVADRCGGEEILRDAPLAHLGNLAKTKNVKKRSRRVDLSFIRDGRLKLVEVTVVRDVALSSRIAEKVDKYSDLVASLSNSPWAMERGLGIDGVAVVAMGVLGTVPESTRDSLRALGFEPCEIEELLREMQLCVLRFNLGPFIDEKKPVQRGAYMRRRQLNLNRRRRIG